jgi:putative SOS response-associated peptidase YedK
VPIWILLKKKEPFAFAGLWDCWRDTEGETLYTFTIITTVPNALVRPIHNRMPVIFDKLLAKQWLDPAFGPSDATLAAILAPYPSALMEVHDVSPLVNKPEYDRADCLNPIAAPQIRLV